MFDNDSARLKKLNRKDTKTDQVQGREITTKTHNNLYSKRIPAIIDIQPTNQTQSLDQRKLRQEHKQFIYHNLCIILFKFCWLLKLCTHVKANNKQVKSYVCFKL